MKEKFDRLSAECSKLATRRYSTSFFLGINFLDKELHKPIYAIYGFVRLTDEIVDSFHNYDKRELLNKFRKDCFEAIELGISLNPILNAFQETVNKYRIDHQLINQFLHSMEMDLDDQLYDQQKFEEYILGSAEVVGLMCLYVFTNGDKDSYEALKPGAMRLGAAFQKINFLRDIGADYLQLNRSYFPGIDLKHFSETDKRNIEQEIEQDFNEALKDIRKLPKSSRRGVYLAYQYYRELFKKIKLASACVVFSKRFRISNRSKLILIFDTLLKHQLNYL
ncbi:phytoene/squalene synthase family protein [Mucilaginibacter rubeus]|uniref:Phytoene/squalene synthase family protein n=1 Tax=Mucilaginibacter rubeus TaxID=2027860 RepID=A0AAE6MHH4_9SPHI|nr:MULTISPECIES: phytoene/squalene synthase family protein [Mucilaginibacter]QEM03561.1 phytoene/squalene synthase family protein [Mucilaginibacter rubeus]QEM16172.1 phytoene/squalene synthase family protein [Mucilaginibacter gossypii]QTE41069.1 phytoene/squalene synthase family protein [Mucilaginibacter rubeus]QTE47672.1 phytoene/squalene synthase family protein [Mucilaginibacter rubeus]QTE59064.1 phytoene/squalene synthase family protein [Mucilaginibacter rubeus]